MKKLISLLLSVIFVSGFILPVSAITTTDGDYEYEISDEGVTITKYLGTAETVEIPSTIEGKKVVKIGFDAFYLCKIKSIILPNSIIEIAEYAFPKCDVESIYIGSGVTVLDGCFFCNPNLKTITISENNKHYTVDSLGILYNKDKTKLIYVPQGTNAETLIIPDSVRYINSYAFMDSKIQNVILPNNLTRIESFTFSECFELKSITIPDSVTRIGERAFSSCSNLSNVKLPSSLKFIGRDAFAWCDALSSIIIPDGVEEIESFAFSGCTNLTNVTIPDSVVKVQEDVFAETPFLDNRYDEKYVIENGILLKYNPYANEAELPEGIRVIAGNAFVETSLTSFTVPESVTHICNYAFYNSSLTSIVLPYELEYIGAYAFEECKNLYTINIPNNVKEIEYNAFYNTKWLNNKTEEFVVAGDNILIKCNSNYTDISIPNGVKYISGIIFENNANIESVTIPDSVITLGEYAFHGLYNLKNISIPDSVTEIKQDAFSLCGSLKNVTIGTGVKAIQSYTFFECRNLENITIKGNIEYIANHSIGHRFEGVKNSNLKIYGIAGSESENYAHENNFEFIPIDADYNIYIEDNLVKGVVAGTKVSDIKKSLENVTVTDKNGKSVDDTAIVGTGYKASIGTNTYEILIMGDISGNGKIDSKDYLLVKRIFLDTYTADEIYLKAACVDGGKTPSAIDYLIIKRHFLGTYNIYE